MCAATWIKAAFLACVSAGAAMAECRDVDFDGASFTICEAMPDDTISLHLDDDAGERLGTFTRLGRHVPDDIVFAMNAGMYHPDRSPVGLYVEDGETLRSVVRREGPGNFGLLPNGVLCLKGRKAQVMKTDDWSEATGCDAATQSGPMLVIDGALHPRFLENSDSLYVRNGVGILPDGRLVAAISNEAVNFHHFARLFRDRLNVRNALFLDGNISRLHAPHINRSDIGFPLGPLLAVTR